MSIRSVTLFKGILAALLILPAMAGSTIQEVSSRFGFSGPEIFPIDNQVAQLKAADIDGDGLQDLLLVNNARSKINILYNGTGQTNNTDALEVKLRREINELPPDARFKIESISSEKRISSMVVADLNHDNRPDIAYYGEPKELIVQYNEGSRKWSSIKRTPISDGTLDAYALVAGDINSDQRTDLLLLADSHVYILPQKEDGTLSEPEKVPYIGTVKSIQVLDIQGDGRDDLLLVNWDNLNPFRFRLQGESGKLGPEMHFNLPPIRSYWADDLDMDRRTEVLTIAQKSGRAQVSTFRQRDPEELFGSWKLGQFQMLPLARTTKAKRGVLWADINNDKRTDLIISEPESGQLSVALQAEDGSLNAPEAFPTLTGISDLVAVDWNENGKLDLFVLSTDERQVGVTSMDDQGSLAFPSALPLPGRPLAVAAGALKFKEKPALAVLTDNEGVRELHLRGPDGEIHKQKLGENFKSNPTSLTVHDLNQDGLPDLIVLIPYEKIKVLLQTSGADFQEVDVAPPGGSAEQPWLSSADVDGDGKAELLLAQRNFLRAVYLKSDDIRAENKSWTLQVKEQINGAASSSRIVAAATVKQGEEKFPGLFLLDADRKALSISRKNTNGVWQIVRNVPLPFTEFTQMVPLALGGETDNAVSLLGLNTVGWFQLQGSIWEFAELDGYESPIKDGFLHDVVSGDLNQDGRKDLVFLETAKSYLDLVTFEQPHKLVPANRWQVFEERTFRSRRNDMAEPREAIIVDLTGDGKNDLAVVVHDRVLVYPQD